MLTDSHLPASALATSRPLPAPAGGTLGQPTLSGRRCSGDPWRVLGVTVGVSALSVWASGVPKARVYGKWIGSTSKGFLIHAPRSTTDVAATDPALNWSDLD